MPTLRFARVVPALAGALALSALSGRAYGFERQWHFGAGGGVANATNVLELGPAIGVHAAYGLSDVFDLRLELGGSHHAVKPRTPEEAAAPTVFTDLYAARLGLAYKLDVIQWIPYLGVTAGVLGANAQPAELETLRACLGLLVGLDYAVTRNIGLGVAFTADYAVQEPVAHSMFLLRAEYRLGW